MIVLVDTNVLIDVLEKRGPHLPSSAEIWRLAETGGVTAHVSAISFNNVFYLVRKQAGSAAALSAVRAIRRTFACVPLDDTQLDQALAIADPDLEDAIQAAAALSVSADYVVTRNVPDFLRLGVRAITPQDFLSLVPP